VLIENNRIETAYGAGIMVGFDTSPEFFDTSTNPEFYENIRCIVRNNLIINTGWEGIGLYASKDAQIYNNTLVNVANYGQYHSAIYFGLTYQDWEKYAGRPASINPNIHHNIVSLPNSNVRPMIEIRYDDNDQLGKMSALDGNPVMNNNCYYIAGKSATFNDRRPGRTLENEGLAAWKTHISGDNGTIEEDPALDGEYMATNPNCAGMGITTGFVAPKPMDNFRVTKTYKPGQFTDVNEDSWYGNNKDKAIAVAFEYNLMAGPSSTTFNPEGNFTIIEAIALAARVHSIYSTGRASFTNGDPWYANYLAYAQEHGIVRKGAFNDNDYGRPATRAEMAGIFLRALPESEFSPQNTVKSLPDANDETPHFDAILALYKAGVFSGGDDIGTFKPGNNITRAEAAAIIAHVILPGTRTSGKTYG